MSRKASSSKPRALVNPAGAVRTAADERRWTKAKELAKKEGRGGDWAYVMGIFKKSRKNPAPAAIKLPPLPKGKRGAVKAIQKLVEVIGPGFHPDTPPEEIVHMDSGKPALTKRQQAHLRTLLDACFILLNDEVYEVALEAAHKALGWDTRVNPSEPVSVSVDDYDFVRLEKLAKRVALALEFGGTPEERLSELEYSLEEGSVLGGHRGLNADWSVRAWAIGNGLWFTDNEDGTFGVYHRSIDEDGEYTDTPIEGRLDLEDGSLQAWLESIAKQAGGTRKNPGGRRVSEFVVGDQVEPDFSKPGWRTKRRFLGTVVETHSDGTVVVEKRNGSRTGIPARMLMHAPPGALTPMSEVGDMFDADLAYHAEHGPTGDWDPARGRYRKNPTGRGKRLIVRGEHPGVVFNVRVLRKGDSYGLQDKLVWGHDEPGLEFYDSRYANKGTNGQWGQVVAQYFASTLAARRPGPLSLQGGIPEWDVSEEGMAQVTELARSLVGTRQNPAPAPGTPKPSMTRVATIARQAGVNPSQARDFLTGFAYEWEEHGGGMDDGAIAQIVLDHLAESPRYYRGRK